VPHVSTGALFRAAVAAETDVGKKVLGYLARGDLVPDDIVAAIVRDEVLKAVRDTGGYLLDGFPRTLAQARAAHALALEYGIAAHAAVTFDVPREVLLERLLGRGTQDGRTDDAAAVIRHRLDVYDAETAPLLDYYAERGVLVRIDGNRPVAEVSAACIAALRSAMAAAPAPP
jgi:adenylate kinase